MPTYEYVCAKCDHRFEKFQSMKDDALKICPADLCPKKKWGKGKVQRQMGGGAGLIFKGSGFYITDYRSKGYQESAKKDSSGRKFRFRFVGCCGFRLRVHPGFINHSGEIVPVSRRAVGGRDHQEMT